MAGRWQQWCTPTVTVRCAVVFLLLLYLVGNSSASCLSYGHSCWGAHGKRSNAPVVYSPSWYISRLLRQAASNNQISEYRHPPKAKYSDADEMESLREQSETENQSMDDESPPNDIVEMKHLRNPGIPMLDDEDLPKTKLWNFMKSPTYTKNEE